MNYIETLAQNIHAIANDGYPYEGSEELYRIYAVLALTTGANTTLENVHDAWAAWRATTNPDHKSLVPFAKLSDEVKEIDRPYCKAIILASVAKDYRCTVIEG